MSTYADREMAFVEEYKALMKKHGVCLVLETGIYEEGVATYPTLKSTGKYCSINYIPYYESVNTGRHCMGG